MNSSPKPRLVSSDRPGRPRDYLDEFPYTGPDRIVGRYLRRFWQPVARLQDIPPGKAKPVTIMNVTYTLYRGQSGTPYLVQQRCPHRGTQLSAGWVQGEEIRCLYHGWKFAGDGACVERPGEAGKSGGGVTVEAFPTREFMGLVYCYLGEGEPPAFPPFPAFEEEGIIETHCALLEVNYFQGWENDWDPYHARFTHYTGGVHDIDYDHALATEVYEESDYGVTRTFEVEPGVRNTAIMMMPNTVQLLIPTYNGLVHEGSGPLFRRTYLAHVPIDDHTHWAFLTQHVPVTGDEVQPYLERAAALQAKIDAAEEPADIVRDVLKNGIRTIDDFHDHPLLVRVEDSLTQLGQGAIADRRAERLGRTDVGVVRLRRLFARELHALENGQPIKQWGMAPLIPLEGEYGHRD